MDEGFQMLRYFDDNTMEEKTLLSLSFTLLKKKNQSQSFRQVQYGSPLPVVVRSAGVPRVVQVRTRDATEVIPDSWV